MKENYSDKSLEENKGYKIDDLSFKRKYSTLELINDLIIELSKHVPVEFLAKTGKTKGRIKLDILSIILGQGKSFLSELLYKITNPKCRDYNSIYKFSIQSLNDFKINLSRYLGDDASGCIQIINKYIELNGNLKKYSKQQWNIHNPNLKVNYFKELDTIEKGYWYGFLCSDGTMQIAGKGRKRYRIGIELSLKDKERLIAFCNSLGLNKEKVRDRIRNIILRGKESHIQMARIEFVCKPMVEDLSRNGFLRFKLGGKIEFVFKNIEVALGFLLGYFDGDGIQGTSAIVSTNYIFLNQVKKYFKIKNPVYKAKNIELIETYNDAKGYIPRSTKPLWGLYLGAQLFNTMLNNYNDSMPRKRLYLREDNVYLDLKKEAKNIEYFQSLVNEYPKTWIADFFEVSPPLIDKLCNEWEIECPPKGYWNKLRKKDFHLDRPSKN